MNLTWQRVQADSTMAFRGDVMVGYVVDERVSRPRVWDAYARRTFLGPGHDTYKRIGSGPTERDARGILEAHLQKQDQAP